MDDPAPTPKQPNLLHFPAAASRPSISGSTPLNSPLEFGQLFRDRYRILKSLGRGGFGATFLVQDESLPGQPFCVIKQLCPKIQDPQSLARAAKRFEREARILAKLGCHAQIPTLLDYFEEAGEFYLVQDYVRGLTLNKEVRRYGVWSEDQVKQFLREILPVLHFIHDQKVIHRDIKPPNLIRCKDDGRLVLIDFGAVKEQISQVDSTQNCKTATTHFIGTMGFAPPEQFALRPTYSTDIYAVGVTCLYLMTGKSPLQFDCDPLTGEIQWRDLISVSDSFGQILSRMIKISVQDRYHSAEEVLRALEVEAYQDVLLPCLHTQPLHPLQPPPPKEPYLSPSERAATAIKRWQARHQARELRRKNRGRRPSDLNPDTSL